MHATPRAPAQWVTTADAAEHISFHRDTLRKLRTSGDGPPFVRVPGTSAIRYDIRELDRWMAKRTFASLDEELASHPSTTTGGEDAT